MNCPKRPEMILLNRITKKFPELLHSKNEKKESANYEPNSDSLIEPKLEYNSEAPADIVIKNACLGLNKDDQLRDIAISGNIITKVGTTKEIAALTNPKTNIIDAKGKSVLPGFTDSHLHLSVAMQRLKSCNVEEVTTAEEFRSKVAMFAKEKADEPVLYIFGLHYFDDPIIPAETCRHFLDDLVSDKPVLVFAHDLHTVWANTKSLEIAELFHEMPPYPHLIEELGLENKILIDDKKYPTGELREPEVYYFVSGPVEAHFAPPVEDQLKDLEKVCHQLSSLGITSVHRMGLAQPAEDISFLLLLIELEQSGKLPLRINTSCSSVADINMLHDAGRAYEARNALTKARNQEISAAELHDILIELLKDAGAKRHDEIGNLSNKGNAGEKHPHMQKVLNASKHIRETTHKKHIKPHTIRTNPHHAEGMPKHLNYHAKVRCDTVKIFMDGVIEKDTAFRVDKKPTAGIPEFDQKGLNSLIEFSDKLGMQVAAHSIGDGSVKSMLDAISLARKNNKALDEKRKHFIPHRVEHIEICQEEDLHRFGKEHVVTSMQPLHERPPVTLWHELVPKSEWNTAFAWKEALANGAVLVFGSDWPIVSCDVRTGINHAITRKPWYKGAKQQGVNLKEALAAYSTGAAFTEYCSNVRGEIKPGMLADITMLSTHITELEKENPKVDIEKTICDGKVVYG